VRNLRLSPSLGGGISTSRRELGVSAGSVERNNDTESEVSTLKIAAAYRGLMLESK
jgi:hypothetical protein